MCRMVTKRDGSFHVLKRGSATSMLFSIRIETGATRHEGIVDSGLRHWGARVVPGILVP